MASQRSATDVELGSWSAWYSEDAPLRIGVSSCLLGEEVRHDGGHARDRFVAEVLTRWVETVSVCPEAEIGMGVPRPTIRLQNEDGENRLVSPKTGEDFTDKMAAFAQRRIAGLQKEDLDGYVLKKNSPSCGMTRIRVYRGGGVYHKQGSGAFAAELMERWPGLPVEEEGRLNDPVLRENFIERMFCRNRWRNLVKRGLSRNRLVQFHTAHKLLVRAHDDKGYQALGRLVGSAGEIPDTELYARYETELQETMKKKATNRKHANVLQHAMGYLKHALGPEDKREILTAIDDFRLGLLPLIVPLTLVRFNVNKYAVGYLQGQIYFDPHPKELMLRNHA